MRGVRLHGLALGDGGDQHTGSHWVVGIIDQRPAARHRLAVYDSLCSDEPPPELADTLCLLDSDSSPDTPVPVASLARQEDAHSCGVWTWINTAAVLLGVTDTRRPSPATGARPSTTSLPSEGTNPGERIHTRFCSNRSRLLLPFSMMKEQQSRIGPNRSQSLESLGSLLLCAHFLVFALCWTLR